MGKRYLDTKKDSLESSILNVWQEAAVKQENRHDGRTKQYKEHRAKLEAARKTRAEKLTAKQKKLDVDGDGEIEGSDLAKLRKKGAKKEGLESSPNKANSQHLCAKNVVHEEWGEGQPVHGMHSEPDEEGNIAWYDVMFEHGVEKGVSIDELVVTKEGHHENHKKKNDKMLKAKYHEKVEESYEFGTDEYRKHTQDVTPGQSVEEYGRLKMQSMKEALAKVWGFEEGYYGNSKKKKMTPESKNGKTTDTGGKMAEVEIDPELKNKK